MLFLGGHTFDMVYALDALPAENAKAKARHVYACAGGPAMNAAITSAILGGRAVYAGALGCGPLTDAVTREAEQYGVRLIRLGAREGDAPCASIALTPGGSRTIWAPPQTETPPGALGALPDAAGFDALLLDGQSPEAAIEMARRFRAAGKPVLLDAGSWKPGMEALITLSTEIIASAAFAVPGEADTLAALIGAGAAFAAITADDRPIRWRDADGEEGEVTPPAVEAVDTLGAGDILHGAYAYFRWTNGLGPADALAEAAQIASRSVTVYGPRAAIA